METCDVVLVFLIGALMGFAVAWAIVKYKQ